MIGHREEELWSGMGSLVCFSQRRMYCVQSVRRDPCTKAIRRTRRLQADSVSTKNRSSVLMRVLFAPPGGYDEVTCSSHTPVSKSPLHSLMSVCMLGHESCRMKEETSSSFLPPSDSVRMLRSILRPLPHPDMWYDESIVIGSGTQVLDRPAPTEVPRSPLRSSTEGFRR